MEMSRFLLTFLFCISSLEGRRYLSSSAQVPKTTGWESLARSKACPVGWSQFRGRCYKYFDNSVKWDDAREHCLSEEADLASIHSEEENDFLREITGNTLVWVGGRRSCPSCEDFKWSDGTLWDFAAWHRVQPDNAGGTEGCVEINFGSSGWNDVLCDRSDRGRFVCKKSLKR